MSQSSARKSVHLITEELFREAYKYEEMRKPPMKAIIGSKFKCSKETLLNLFPIARWLPHYSVRNALINDIIAGITVAIMHIPHGLSYAPLGGVQPVVGLYMAIFPVFIYMFMGSSRQISIGTFAVVCAMAGDVVHNQQTSIQKTETFSVTNSTAEAINITKYNEIEIGMAVCFFVGIWQVTLGLFRLGSVMVIMSESLISGFTTGAACYVFSYQLKHLFGVNVHSFSGILKLIYIYYDFFSKIKTLNLVTVAISLCAVIILLFFNEFLKPLIKKKYPKNRIPVPIELVVIVLGILISYFADLSDNFNVNIVNHIPRGFPVPQFPPFSLFLSIIIESFVIAIVALAINLSLAKIFAKKADYVISDNQELLAYGAANIFSSFFFCLPSAASLSRSSIQFSAGGKTQLASLFCVVLIVLTILFAGPLFEPVPYCILSSIVVVTLKSLLMQIFDFPKIWKRNYWDGIVWLGTFLAVIILDISIGLVVGIILSVLTMTCSSIVFQVNVMGRVPGTSIYLDVDRYKAAVNVPNVLILQIVGTVNFATCQRLEKNIMDRFKLFRLSVIESHSYLVLNMGSTPRIDPTTVTTFKQLYQYLNNSNSSLYITDCNTNVYKTFEVCGFFSDVPKDHVVATVNDAVEYLTTLLPSGPNQNYS